MKSLPPRAERLGIIRCHICGLVFQPTEELGKAARCPRCAAPVHRRLPNSVVRTWAFLIAGVILYIPANILPVMYTSFLGNGIESTIADGVIGFWNSGSYGIALVIFIASIAVPSAKFLILATLLITVRTHSRWARPERARLYRMIEHIGYWSMLDVLVVAVVVALVKFRELATIEPRVGILFFGAVVILTMLSAMSFDPRLIWDDKE